MSRKLTQSQLIIAGLAAAAVGSFILYMATTSSSKQKKLDDDDDDDTVGTNHSRDVPRFSSDIIKKGRSNSISASSTDTQTISNKSAKSARKTVPVETVDPASAKLDDKALHARIEEMDKRGKTLFKEKKFLEAAEAFTEALEFIESNINPDGTSAKVPTSLNRQIITLINNRSAMYEKGSLPELALEDCKKILDEYDISHIKARTRKLRILEQFSQHYDALVEVCAMQLLYMHQNRDKLRMGLPPSSPPPVPQNKLEELIVLCVPSVLKEWEVKLEKRNVESTSLPSDYTLLQLLKSYTGYNAWMAKAAKDGAVRSLETKLAEIPEDNVADRASLEMKIGRRYIFDGEYEKARGVILKAFNSIKVKPEVSSVMDGDDYARLLEWTGMIKHWAFDLDGANSCYEKCAALEPLNAEVLVKQAGVAMDGVKHDKALELFAKALAMDPDAVDALLHRANLRMLQQDLPKAETDLKRCVELRPNHVLAHLRLAAVLSSKSDMKGAKHHLEQAEVIDPNSSEVQSYRGELLFTENDFAGAKVHFHKAIKLEPKNPTPYVNAALAELNMPPQAGEQMKMAQEAMRLLTVALEVDPQFNAAYVQLGQLKLGMSQDLNGAEDVVTLYEKGLENCRTSDEMKELCSMRTLTQAQVDAARALKMESFNMT